MNFSASVQRDVKDSQAFSVGWDYDSRRSSADSQNLTKPAALLQAEVEPKKPSKRLFIISGVGAEEREEIGKQLEALGAIVSNSATYESSCTHLICPKLTRNEKLLCCMAAGKWILHSSYVDRCHAAGEFLDVS